MSHDYFPFFTLLLVEEIYSIVNFVRPGYFDSLSDFKRSYQDPILAGKIEGASREAICRHDQALSALQSKLASIMLQRSHNGIVKSNMPEKTIYFIACDMTQRQRDNYESEADRILRYYDGTAVLPSTSLDDEGNQLSNSNILSGLQKLRSIANVPHSCSDSSVDDILNGSVKLQVCLHKTSCTSS